MRVSTSLALSPPTCLRAAASKMARRLPARAARILALKARDNSLSAALPSLDGWAGFCDTLSGGNEVSRAMSRSTGGIQPKPVSGA